MTRTMPDKINNPTEAANLSGDELLNFVVEYAHQQKDNMSGLSVPVQTAYFISNFEAEFHNGGIHQFFGNSAGRFATETVESFARIGAPIIASLVEKGASLDAEAALDDEEIFKEFEELDSKLHGVYPTNDNGNVGQQLVVYLQENKNDLIPEASPN